jgi:hypothetical protein
MGVPAGWWLRLRLQAELLQVQVALDTMHRVVDLAVVGDALRDGLDARLRTL